MATNRNARSVCERLLGICAHQIHILANVEPFLIWKMLRIVSFGKIALEYLITNQQEQL